MKSLLVAVAGLLTLNVAHADLNKSMDQMCAKMKTCGTAELEKQDIPADMKQAMLGMFDTMCKATLEPHMKSVGNAGLEKKATACVDSMVKESCEALMQNEGQYRSEECDEFEKAANDAGLDLDS